VVIAEWFNASHQWLFEQIVQPFLYRTGWMSYDELAYDWTHLFLLGAIEVVLLWALIRPLEIWLPVERWTDRKATRVDVLYTLLARLGVLPIFFFIVLTPSFDWINAQIRLAGIIPPSFDNLLFYLVVLDFADYWRHRFEHRFKIWWALHSVHHSQRQMTFWSDEREHLVGQLIAAIWRASVGLAIGAPPAAFVTVTLVTAAIESFSHANVRLSFGRIGDRLVVSPLFHRVHHAMGIERSGRAMGCNFASVLPIWDILFGTANFSHVFLPTGIEDQLTGRDYGEGFWRQQWLAFRRM
jgi:sterol desaturase/sphingolipid hydroxylase (fatty acid hydroxylase superfamily)